MTTLHTRTSDNTKKTGEMNTTDMRTLDRIIHAIMTILQ